MIHTLALQRYRIRQRVDLPPRITATTGMDALAHNLEAFCAPGFHPMADGIALEGIRLVKNSLSVAFKDGKNIGFCEYKFIQKDSFLEVQNITKFNVDLLGLKIFTIDSHGTEVYKNNKLISFKSKT